MAQAKPKYCPAIESPMLWLLLTLYRQYGVTAPISVAAPTPADLKRTEDLEKGSPLGSPTLLRDAVVLRAMNLYENHESARKREQTLGMSCGCLASDSYKGRLNNLVQEWIKRVYAKKVSQVLASLPSHAVLVPGIDRAIGD
jgi:hypothetical protein